MAKNVFQASRTAFANVTFPTSNSTIVSSGSNVYIPKGAIITAVRVMAGDAVTLSDLANCTAAIYVGGLSVASGIASVAQTVPKQYVLASTGGVYVTAGGDIIFYLGSATSTTGGLVGDMDVYVDYLYCTDRDDA